MWMNDGKVENSIKDVGIGEHVLFLKSLATLKLVNIAGVR